MLPAAGAGGLALLLLVALVPGRLARAGWPRRAPARGLLLWQALGLTCGVLAVEVGLTLALAPSGDTHGEALGAVVSGAGRFPWWAVGAGLLALLLALRLASTLVAAAVRTLRDRRDHRALVDLVATRNPLLPGARVVDSDLPLAYCLPGLRPRVVLSRGVLEVLREDEVHAVLAHENAHAEQRHDLVVLPFVALGRTFPRLPPVRTALQEVSLLVEMLADDRALRSSSAPVLARALCKVGAAVVPGTGDAVPAALTGSATGPGGDVLVRASRLVSPPPPLGWTPLAAVTAVTTLVVVLPALVLLVPLAV